MNFFTVSKRLANKHGISIRDAMSIVAAERPDLYRLWKAECHMRGRLKQHAEHKTYSAFGKR